jgi:hypothetical protein
MAGVTLRPLVEADLDVIDAALDSEEAWTALQWFGHGSSAKLRAALAERRLLNGPFNMFAVVAGEDLAGRVGWFERSWGPPATCTCWEISIAILPHNTSTRCCAGSDESHGARAPEGAPL